MEPNEAGARVVKSALKSATSWVLEENRQKWREFCYTVNSLAPCATRLMSCRFASVLKQTWRYCSAVVMEEEALKYTDSNVRPSQPVWMPIVASAVLRRQVASRDSLRPRGCRPS